MITVAIPAHSRPQLLKDAVESCLAQQFQDFEVLISDDSESDVIARMIAGFSSPRIRYIRHETRIGLDEKLNELLTQAKGRWFVILGDDDRLEPGYLSAMNTILTAHPDAALIRTKYRFMDTDGRFINFAENDPERTEPVDTLNIVFRPWYERMVNITGVLFPRQNLIELGGFLRTERGWNSDTAAWAWLATQGPSFFEQRALIHLRFNTGSDYKKFSLNYDNYLAGKRMFFDSMTELFRYCERFNGPQDRRKMARAYKMFLKYWMREEVWFRFDEIFLHYLSQKEGPVAAQVRRVLDDLKRTGLPLISGIYFAYAVLGRLPGPLRLMGVHAWKKARSLWWKFFPPKRWTFFKPRAL